MSAKNKIVRSKASEARDRKAHNGKPPAPPVKGKLEKPLNPVKPLKPMMVVSQPPYGAREKQTRTQGRKVGREILFPIVGIGGSAGGLEAFTRLLSSVPPNANMAFVVVQHLSPDSPSLLPELLSKVSGMAVHEAVNGMKVRSGNVYVIPPRVVLTINNGLLHLEKRINNHAHMPIDVFFRSLAQDRGALAAAVVLSGAGTDGSLGLEDIKAAGGVTFCQDNQSSKFDTMPRSALATGNVDFVLPPEEIARELARIFRLLQGAETEGAGTPDASREQQQVFHNIFALLRAEYGVDFTFYKHTTIKRRINRRMVLMKKESLQDYLLLLKEKQEELDALYQDILIKVTCFFRDPDSFESLKKKVFPAMLKNKQPETPIRIWIPGCSTGEEVYSVAISLLEVLGDMATNTRVQIFATDISNEAIEKARAGIYIENIAMDISQERLRRFFNKVDGHYQISKHIRDMCVFARQNVSQDHPFSKLDLICCRNLLIYLDLHLQKKVFPIFHYALKPTGFLMLGTSETVGTFTDHFSLVDKKNKIYAKKLVPTRFNLNLSGPSYLMGKPDAPKRTTEQPWPAFDAVKEADKVVLAKYSPVGVVINEDMEILQFRGQTGAFLEPAPGQASFNLLRMVRSSLLMDLRKTLDRVKRDKKPVLNRDIVTEEKGRLRHVSIEIIPLNSFAAREHYNLVLFEERDPMQDGMIKDAEESSMRKVMSGGAGRKSDTKITAINSKGAGELRDGQAARLKRELEAAKEYLQSIIEEQEATNEELKSANEEILSSNEELQSTNEELETAKEELQSTNEELTTLNEELQNRNLELSQLNNDLNNLLSSVHVPIIMLGNDFTIRRFTPMAEKLLKLIPRDIGRPLGDIKTDILPADLDQILLDVIETVTLKEIELQDGEGHWFILRLRPYKTLENKIDGVVMVFIDIDVHKKVTANLTRLNSSLEREVMERRKVEESLQETISEIEDFSYSVSHDLRAPLRGMQGIAQVLLEDYGDQLDASGQDYARRIIEAANRMDTLIQDLLSYSRMGRMELTLLPVSLEKTVEDVLEQVDKEVKDRSARITVDGPLPEVMANELTLSAVLLNLVLNAIKFVAPGVQPEVRIRSERNDGNVRLFVEDKGIGVEKEHHERIFKIFERLHGMETYPGTGIGLAIVRKAMERMNGRFGLNSEIGRGSSFWIELPAAPLK